MLEEALRLLVEDIEAVPGPRQAQVAPDNTDVGFHDLVHLLHALGDQDALLVGDRPLVVPFGDIGVVVVTVDDAQRVLGGGLGVDNRLDQRVRRQTVTAMQARTRALADRVEPADA